MLTPHPSESSSPSSFSSSHPLLPLLLIAQQNPKRVWVDELFLDLGSMAYSKFQPFLGTGLSIGNCEQFVFLVMFWDNLGCFGCQSVIAQCLGTRAWLTLLSKIQPNELSPSRVCSHHNPLERWLLKIGCFVKLGIYSFYLFSVHQFFYYIGKTTHQFYLKKDWIQNFSLLTEHFVESQFKIFTIISLKKNTSTKSSIIYHNNT